jgi:hypothetical protein
VTAHHFTITAQSLARALGGEVSGDQVRAPGLGHRPGDRSMCIRIAPDHPDGFVVHSHAPQHTGLECKDYIRDKAGLPRWEPKAKQESSRRPSPLAEYIYRDADGAPSLKVVRFPNKPDGRKDIRQMRWTGKEWEWGKPKGPKIPYQLPALLEYPDSPVFVVEGEKDADNLHRLGLLATTSSEGAGKWTPELAPWFKGRTVYVLPDNDDPGRKHARQVAQNLHGIAAEVRVVELPGLPEKGDVSDWIANDGGVEELLRLCEVAPLWTPEHARNERPVRTSQFFSAASLKHERVTERPFVVLNLVPDRNVTSLMGDGGTGKSLLAHQLAVAMTAGCTWLGMEVKQGPVIYLSAEDDKEELHRRTDDILREMGRTYDDVADLTMRSLAGEDALLAVESGLTLMQSELFNELEKRAADETPALVLIDTVADVYPANENDRAKVRQFVGILRGLAIRQKCAVMLLGHPSLSGLSSGSGMSGSTAWNNSVRSRLYLSRIVNAGSEGVHEPNPDKRILRTMKANYGPVGGEIGLTWQRGVFVADAAPTGLDRMAVNAKPNVSS